MNLILVPIAACLNRLRGMDTPSWLPISNRITASIGMALIGLYLYGVYGLIVGPLWLLWASFKWMPKDNWSASAPIKDFKVWYKPTVKRNLYALLLLCPLVTWGWGYAYYYVGPNKWNLRHHTVWAEFTVGALWGINLLIVKELLSFMGV